MRILIFILLTMAQAFAADFVIKNESTDASLNEKALLAHMRKAKDAFENQFGPLNENIQISIQSRDCLRTGYNFVDKKVVFCSNKNTINYGLNSADVINHELFHAFICQKLPAKCQKNNLNVPAHEALADYFSYLLIPDQNFGESYYTQVPYIRSYFTDFHADLVENDYEIANAYVTELIQKNVSLKNAARLLDTPKPVADFRLTALDLPQSELGRYRLVPLNTYRFRLEFRSSAVAKISVENESRDIAIQVQNKNNFTIKLLGEIKAQAFFINFHDQRNRIIGRKKIYLGSAL